MTWIPDDAVNQAAEAALVSLKTEIMIKEDDIFNKNTIMEKSAGLEKSNNYQVFTGRIFENILSRKVYVINAISLKIMNPESDVPDFEVMCSFSLFPVGIENFNLMEEVGCFFNKYSMK